MDLDPGHLLIDQFSDKLIVDWESFSIDSGELTQFLQPGSGSSALNRVMSGDPSQIFGSLEANGNIWLINPNGILIGPSGSVVANGFIASTMDVSDADFLSGGEARFSGQSQQRVENLGQIQGIGGDVFLIAREVRNAGSIKAPEGTVGLAGGTEIIIAPEGEERIRIIPEGNEGAVDNSGVIEAATAELNAAGGNAYALALNNSGVVRATEIESRGGRIFLTSGTGGMLNTGSLTASREASGGEIQARGQGSMNLGGRIDASSEVGPGGQIEVSGNEVNVLPEAKLTASGTEAGEVTLLGTETTRVSGQVIANGGLGNGGNVTLQGAEIDIQGSARIEADGALQGGNILVGRDPRNPDAMESSTIQMGPDASLSASGETGDGGTILVFGTSESDLSIGSAFSADSTEADGGDILLIGGDVLVDQTAQFRANGGQHGGTIQIEGEGDVSVAGNINAEGSTGDGGFIHVQGENVMILESASLNASGAMDGGFVQLTGGEEGNVSIAGELLATGKEGSGGMIQITGGDITMASTSLMDASGLDGGFIDVEAGNSVVLDGTARAIGRNGNGGRVQITGEEVSLGANALLDASGAAGGGEIFVGGGAQGRASEIKNAQNTSLAEGAQLIANATQAGDGGTIILWADGSTDFRGSIENRGAGSDAAGGFAEVSGLEELIFDGLVDTGGGDLLLDPFNYNIGLAEATAISAVLNAGTSVTVDTISASAAGAPAVIGALTPTPGNIFVSSAVNWDSTANLSLVAGNQLTLNADVGNSNASGGDLNLVAGWDEFTPFDPVAFTNADLATTTAFGNPGGDIFINTQPAGNVRVGSRAGATRVFAEDLIISAGNFQNSQLGFNGANGGAGFVIPGDILIRTTGAVATRVTSATANFGNAQIGHIGEGIGAPAADGIVTGNISIESLGHVLVNANGATNSSARIGHGGTSAEAMIGGTIQIDTAQDVRILTGTNSMNGNFAQIGSGGRGFTGSTTTDITIGSARNVEILIANTNSNTAQLGNGGPGASGSLAGNIDVTLSNDLTITGGPSPNQAILGNGDTPGDSDAGSSVAGNVFVRVGGNAMITEGTVGHQVDPTGSYTAGNTFIGVGQVNYVPTGPGTLTADAASNFISASRGELRFYIPGNAGYQIAAGANLNGTAAPAPGTDPLPNTQGGFLFGNGTYVAPFSFYDASGAIQVINVPDDPPAPRVRPVVPDLTEDPIVVAEPEVMTPEPTVEMPELPAEDDEQMLASLDRDVVLGVVEDLAEVVESPSPFEADFELPPTAELDQANVAVEAIFASRFEETGKKRNYDRFGISSWWSESLQTEFRRDSETGWVYWTGANGREYQINFETREIRWEENGFTYTYDPETEEIYWYSGSRHPNGIKYTRSPNGDVAWWEDGIEYQYDSETGETTLTERLTWTDETNWGERPSYIDESEWGRHNYRYDPESETTYFIDRRGVERPANDPWGEESDPDSE